MFDATGKFPTGILKGNIQWLGNYKECINASLIPGVNDAKRCIYSHYCPVTFGMPMVCTTLSDVFDLVMIWFVIFYFIFVLFVILISDLTLFGGNTDNTYLKNCFHDNQQLCFLGSRLAWNNCISSRQRID